MRLSKIDDQAAAGDVFGKLAFELGGEDQDDGRGFVGDLSERREDSARDALDIVEGENAPALRRFFHSACGGGKRFVRRTHRIEQGAEHAGSSGFAAAGGSAKDQDGVWTFGAHGDGEPGERAGPVFAGGYVEQLAEAVEGTLVRLLRLGKLAGMDAALKREGDAVLRLPTFAGDFDGVGFGIGEVEQDGAVAGDEPGSGGGLAGGSELGFGFQSLDRAAQCVGRGRGVGFRMKAVGHPVAEIGRIQRVRVCGESAVGHGGVGPSPMRAEEGAHGGDGEERVPLFAATEFGRGLHMFLRLESSWRGGKETGGAAGSGCKGGK